MNGEKKKWNGKTGNLTEPHKICVKYFSTTNEHRLICQLVIWVRLEGKTHFIHFLEARWVQMDDVILAESLRHSPLPTLSAKPDKSRIAFSRGNQIKMKLNR